MSKIKIEIKSRWSGIILFEYEKENNTIKDTLEKAIEEGANLEGANLYGANLKGANLERANLKGANLRRTRLREAYLKEVCLIGANLEGANLKGANLYMWDYDEPDIDRIIKKIENNSNLKIKKYYINKHILSPVYSNYWKNGLIIDEYEVVEPKVKEMTISEISEALGYEVKVVKEHE